MCDWLDEQPVDPHAPRQHGATADCHIMTRTGQQMRIITYTDPATGQPCEFLTNEMDLPAGVIAELYRRRWDVEKVFDQIKNKLGEKKAWGHEPGGQGDARAVGGADPQPAVDI